MIILLPSLGFLVGLSAARAAAETFRQGAHLLREPHLAGVLLFVGLLPVPLGLYLGFTSPGWLSCGLCGEQGLVWWLYPAAAGAALLLGGSGFMLGVVLLRSRLTNLLWILMAATGIGMGTVLKLAERLSNGAAQWPLGGMHAVVLAFALPLVIAGWVFLLLLYALESRKVRLAIAYQREVAPESPMSQPRPLADLAQAGASNPAQVALPVSQPQVASSVAPGADAAAAAPLPVPEAGSRPIGPSEEHE